jgi:hypothetical protein
MEILPFEWKHVYLLTLSPPMQYLFNHESINIHGNASEAGKDCAARHGDGFRLYICPNPSSTS